MIWFRLRPAISFGWFSVVFTVCSKKSYHAPSRNYLQLENTWTILRILWDPSGIRLIFHCYLWISWWYLWNSSLWEILYKGLMAQPDSNWLVCSLCDFPYKNRVCMTTVLTRISFAEFFWASHVNRTDDSRTACSALFSMNNKVLKFYTL